MMCGMFEADDLLLNKLNLINTTPNPLSSCLSHRAVVADKLARFYWSNDQGSQTLARR